MDFWEHRSVQDKCDLADLKAGTVRDDETPPEEMDWTRLSPRQMLALRAFHSGSSITDAAKAAGVTRQTLHRWRTQFPRTERRAGTAGSAAVEQADSWREVGVSPEMDRMAPAAPAARQIKKISDRPADKSKTATHEPQFGAPRFGVPPSHPNVRLTFLPALWEALAPMPAGAVGRR